MIRALTATLALACLTLGPADAQTPDELPVPEEDTPPKPRPQLPGNKRPVSSDPFAALRPGVLPAGTAPEAAARFTALAPKGAEGAPLERALTAFDLEFEIVTRGEGPQTNEARLAVRYAEPAYISFSVQRNKHMGFGPKGYWQAFPDDTRLLDGRDYEADRKRIGEVRSVARNFLSLVDPRRLRVTRLWLPEAGPTDVPGAAQKGLDGLVWLGVESPDFDVTLTEQVGLEKARDGRLFRALLGIDPADPGRVREALVTELVEVEQESGERERVAAPRSALWVRLSEPMTVGATTMPGIVHVFVRGVPRSLGDVPAFEPRPREELYLLKGELNPELAPETFDPPGL